MVALTTSGNCIKYSLFIFNFLFVITGIILLAIGIAVQSAFHDYRHFLDDEFFSVPKLLIAIGIIIFIIAFFGCCGAIKENYCMILSFSGLLVLVFILQLAAGISGYVLRNQTKELLWGSLNSTMYLYNNESKSNEYTILWDQVQRNFECCGLDTYEDWFEPLDHELPVSCCMIPNGVIGSLTCDSDSEGLFKAGCVQQFGSYIKSHAVSLGAAGIALAVIQFAAIFGACYIAREFKRYHGDAGIGF